MEGNRDYSIFKFVLNEENERLIKRTRRDIKESRVYLTKVEIDALCVCGLNVEAILAVPYEARGTFDLDELYEKSRDSDIYMLNGRELDFQTERYDRLMRRIGGIGHEFRTLVAEFVTGK